MKGDSLEAEISKKYHTQHNAVLVSPKLLRSKGLGQIDVSYMENNKIIILEVKSSRIGKQVCYSSKQITRLRYSTLFLCQVFKLKSELKFIAKR